MTRRENLRTFSPKDPVSLVRAEISETTHSGFPVLDDDHLVGMITIGYFRGVGAQEDLRTPIGEVMARNLITITPRDTLEDALQLMMQHDIHHLPVVDPANPGLLVGFLTRTDIMTGYMKFKVAAPEEKASLP
jgi:CIC family chloride channel protein